jgi:hypothetical protein
MAKRKQLWHPDEVRQKIQASQLINRLTENALSNDEIMTASQVNSAKILLGKAIPDLKAMELSGPDGGPIETLELSGSDKLKSYMDSLAKRSGTDSSASE